MRWQAGQSGPGEARRPAGFVIQWAGRGEGLACPEAGRRRREQIQRIGHTHPKSVKFTPCRQRNHIPMTNTVDSLHFRVLEDIAKDLSGEINFPTYLDASMTVRNVLRDPRVSVEKVAQVISIEPLIAARLLRLANSVTYNRPEKHHRHPHRHPPGRL